MYIQHIAINTFIIIIQHLIIIIIRVDMVNNTTNNAHFIYYVLLKARSHIQGSHKYQAKDLQEL